MVFFLKPEGFEDLVPSIRKACLQPAAVLQGQWARLLWAPLLHADSLHLYYNMSSFLWKVRLRQACWAQGWLRGRALRWTPGSGEASGVASAMRYRTVPNLSPYPLSTSPVRRVHSSSRAWARFPSCAWSLSWH